MAVKKLVKKSAKVVKKTAKVVKKAQKVAKKVAKKATKKLIKAKTKSKIKKAMPKVVKKLDKITKSLTKLEMYKVISERTQLTKKQVSEVITELGNVMRAHVKSGQKFVLPGVMRAVVRKVPAKDARQGTNPFTGEPTIFKARPASKKVVIKALKALKDAAA